MGQLSPPGPRAPIPACCCTNSSGSPKACTPLWTYNAGDTSVNTAPTVANGVVYASGPFNHSPGLDAFSAAGTTNCSGTPKTCAPLWTGPAGQYFYSSPAIANGVVYATSTQKVYAFSP